MINGKTNKMKTGKKSKKKNPPPAKVSQKIQQQRLAFHHEGPLPLPQILDQYDKIVTGAAQRIIAMAEKQASHRQGLELIVIKSGSRDSLLGLIFGLIIGLSTIIGGVICILSGYSTEGTILGGSGLVSLIGVFVYGSRQKRTERELKHRGSQ